MPKQVKKRKNLTLEKVEIALDVVTKMRDNSIMVEKDLKESNVDFVSDLAHYEHVVNALTVLRRLMDFSA